MAKGPNQKLKLLFLARIFMAETDEEHGLSCQELIQRLNEYEVTEDRKTLYLDLEELRYFGMDIVSEQTGRNVLYRLASREFELPELKLLVDSVQSAKFITERKSRELIAKLETLASRYEARKLHRQVLISGRVKTINESIYYNVDKLHTAIGEDRQIRFQYFQWNVKKEMELRHGGAWYQISPWALVWDDEYYYLIGYDPKGDKIKHYRVDKMLSISLLDEKREGREMFQTLDLPQYSRGLFGMFGGEETTVTLECENHMAAVMIDRFGKDVPMRPTDPSHFQVRIQVSASEHFLGWVVGLGGGVRIVAPQAMTDAMKALTERLQNQYQ